MIRHLLAAKWQQLRNTPKSGGGGQSKALLFIVFGLLIWIGIFAGSHWFLGKCLEVEPIGELIVEKTLDFVLLIVFSMLLFSSVITAFSTFFLAEDLELLMSRPLNPDALYTARLLETFGLAAWMPTLFALPVFIDAGILFGAGWSYFALVPLVLIAMGGIASAIAVPLTMTLTNVLPAQRTKDVLLFLGVLVFVIVFILFRTINPESMLRGDEFNNTMELFASLGTPSSVYLPSSWALEALRPSLRGDSEFPVMHLGALLTTSAGLYFIGAWVFRRWHFSGYSKALEGRQAGSGFERATGWLRRKQASGPEMARRSLDKLASRGGRLRPVTEMMLKDARVFIRDTAQWSQLLLLVALVAIYLLNFRYFKTLGDGGIIGSFGLFVMNVGLCGFIVASVGLRFLFPAISLEGRAFWLIVTSPQTVQNFVFSKAVTGAIPMLLISQLLTTASNLMIGTSVAMTIASALVVTVLVVGLAGLGVGIGAMYPRFDTDNASKIGTSFGGMLYMLCGLALVLVVVLMMVPGAWMLARLAKDGTTLLQMPRLWVTALCSMGVLVVRVWGGVGAMGFGAKRLGKLG